MEQINLNVFFKSIKHMADTYLDFSQFIAAVVKTAACGMQEKEEK